MSRAKIVRQLNIDPALSYLGWSITDYNTETGTLTVVRFGTFEASRLAGRVAHREEVDIFTKRMISLRMIRDYLKLLMDEFSPEFVTIESAFFGIFRPNAYSALVQVICTIEFYLMNEYQMPVYKVAPKSAKQCLTGSGAAGKAPIQHAIFEKEDIAFKQKKQAEKLGEHEADSISVGYFFTKNVLPGKLAEQQAVEEAKLSGTKVSKTATKKTKKKLAKVK